VPGDDDADGVPDDYDTQSSDEKMTAYDPSPVAPMAISAEYPVATSPTCLALLATAQADDALATIAVDVYNAAGSLVATSGPLPGVATVTVPSPGAGNFSVKVRNLGGNAASVTPTIVVRDLLPLP
jgi:hypothetical protein